MPLIRSTSSRALLAEAAVACLTLCLAVEVCSLWFDSDAEKVVKEGLSVAKTSSMCWRFP